MRTKVTNKLGLPTGFVKAIENDPYDPNDGGEKSDYTITGLLKPPRMSQLEKTSNVTEDAADKLYSLQGQIIHGILERSKVELELEGYIVEKRLYKRYIVNDRIFTVSAKVDIFDPVEARVSDYKYTSVAAAKHGLKDEHKWQVNFQVELIRYNGFQVERADATILMRDWSAERVYKDYPESPCMFHKIPLLTSKEVDIFVIERIKMHEAAKNTLPLCTQEERWNRPTFAVMKDAKAKRATRVFDTEEEAKDFIKTNNSSFLLVKRSGEDVRCLRYCPVRTVCEQAKANLPTPTLGEDGFYKVSNNGEDDNE